MLPVTLQINTAPVDYAFLPKILRHQLNVFGASCKEILLTVETRQSKKTRWKSDDWERNLSLIYELHKELQKDYPHLKLNPIDYSDKARKDASGFFLSKENQLIPFKDFRGGPYYSYYYGLYSASEKYVLHMDSDMVYHGDGESWLQQAIDLLQNDQKLLIAAPHIGPPVREGKPMPTIHKKRYNPISNYGESKNAYVYKDMSTRVFLVEKKRLKKFCPITYPHLDQIVKSWVRKTPPYHTPERSISVAMQKDGLFRVDFLGSGKGLWNIHCDIARNPEFVKMLDHVIHEIEKGFFTESQRGWPDFSRDLFDALKESFSK